MEDLRQQLSALLGREVKQVRKTDETPPRVSVIDVVSAIAGQERRNEPDSTLDSGPVLKL